MKKNGVIILCIMLLFCGCGNKTQAVIFEQTTASEITETVTETQANISDSVSEVESVEADTDTDTEDVEESRAIVLCFAGDINFDENWPTMQCFNEQKNGLSDCISEDIIEDVKSSDLFMLNNEFTYSDRGTPMEGKMYTFRAKPQRVDLLKDMGVDIVLLANNHVYDYGKDAMLDTFDVLKEADIDYVGAGRDITEACNIVYYDIEGMKIAYVAASRAEKNRMTPQATENSLGILRAYDSERFIELVKEAKQNSDFVVANIHWGTEYSYELEAVQIEIGHALVEAGADAVIGTHPHVLQGIEIYKEVPIFYSLGNFWFNEKDLYSGYIKLSIDTTNKTIKDMTFVPCVQQNCATRLYKDEQEEREIFDFIEDISPNVTINNEGIITENN